MKRLLAALFVLFPHAAARGPRDGLLLRAAGRERARASSTPISAPTCPWSIPTHGSRSPWSCSFSGRAWTTPTRRPSTFSFPRVDPSCSRTCCKTLSERLEAAPSSRRPDISNNAFFLASARTYTTGPSGSYGLSSEGISSFNGGGQDAVLSGIRNGNGFRTNTAVVSVNKAPLRFQVSAYDLNGSPMGTRSVSLPPFGQVQVPVSSFAGAFDSGYLVWTCLTMSGPIDWTAYATPIDNASGGASFVLDRRDDVYRLHQNAFNLSGTWTGPAVLGKESERGVIAEVQQIGPLLKVTFYDSVTGEQIVTLQGYEDQGTVSLTGGGTNYTCLGGVANAAVRGHIHSALGQCFRHGLFLRGRSGEPDEAGVFRHIRHVLGTADRTGATRGDGAPPAGRVILFDHADGHGIGPHVGLHASTLDQYRSTRPQLVRDVVSRLIVVGPERRVDVGDLRRIPIHRGLIEVRDRGAGFLGHAHPDVDHVDRREQGGTAAGQQLFM